MDSLPCRHVPLLAGALLLLAAPASAAESARWHLARDGAAGAGVGTARIWPAGPVQALRVVADGGAALGAQVVWSAPGEPCDLLFEAGGGVRGVTVSLAAPGEVAAWSPQAGVVCETRPRRDLPVDTPEQVAAAWAGGGDLQGRSVVPQVYDALNRHGPDQDFCSRYVGWLAIADPGAYEFATISDDGSLLLVDGRAVCSWTGWHGANDGRHGQHHGTAGLSAGLHRLEYLHVQGGGETIAEAAWKPPGAAGFAVIPAEAFAPVARFAVDRVEGDPAAFAWDLEGHTRIGGQALVDVAFRALAAKGATVSWTFDDGCAAEGATVRHCFARPGEHRVAVAVRSATGVVVRAERAVAVHPRWQQGDDVVDQRWHAQRKEWEGRDLAPMALADLAAAARFAEAMDGDGFARHLLDAAIARIPAAPSAGASGDADGLEWLAFRCQDSEVRRYDAAVAAFRALLAVPGLAPERAARLRVHAAGLLLHGLGDVAAAEELIAASDAAKVDDTGRRLLALFAADARLLRGDVAGARERYAAIGSVVKPDDAAYALRRRLRLEQAKDFSRDGDQAAAEALVREVEWETPAERIGSETGLLMVAIWSARREWPFALTRCRMMLAAAAPSDPHRADVLLATCRIHLATGDRDSARAAAKRLRTDHPFSEAAARVADLVPEEKKP